VPGAVKSRQTGVYLSFSTCLFTMPDTLPPAKGGKPYNTVPYLLQINLFGRIMDLTPNPEQVASMQGQASRCGIEPIQTQDQLEGAIYCAPCFHQRWGAFLASTFFRTSTSRRCPCRILAPHTLFWEEAALRFPGTQDQTFNPHARTASRTECTPPWV